MYGYDSYNRGRYNSYGSRGGYGSNSYGYGYGYSQPRSGGFFGRQRNSYGYDSGYGGYGSSYGYGGGGFGMFGRRGMGSYGYGGGFGMFGRRGMGAYTGRRGIFSLLFGGVGLGITAIGALIHGASTLNQVRKENATAKGTRPYGTLDLTLLWRAAGQGEGATVLIAIPITLSLFYLDGSEEAESRYTVKVGKKRKIQVKSQTTLKELYDEVEDDVTYCVNFDIQQKENSERLLTVPVKECAEQDEWVKLQAISERFSECLSKLEDLLKREHIRNEPVEFSRLASTMFAAVAEQAGFASAHTVDCKQEMDDEIYSWCATDVVLTRSSSEQVRVRVDLLHYVFEEEEVEEGAGVFYAFADGGVDLFDGRETVSGSGPFTGWADVKSHLASVHKGMMPTARGNGLKIPIISSLASKSRESKRISARRERRKVAFAQQPNTDVIFRNLLWYDTESKPGKVIMKVLPFCLLATYDEVDGVPDRDSEPVDISYNFLPVETEYVCNSVDLELYAEEIAQGVSFPLNFSIASQDGRCVMRQHKLNSLKDDWERLQLLVEITLTIVDSILSKTYGWLDSVNGPELSCFESALLAAVLGLAGFLYACPILTEDKCSVTDVALIRPGGKISIDPYRILGTIMSQGQKQKTFDKFTGGRSNLFRQCTSNSVLVRVDLHVNPTSYGYVEYANELGGIVPVSSKERTGSEPFTGWKNDISYQARRKASDQAKRKAKATKSEQRDKGALVSAPQVEPAPASTPEESSAPVEVETSSDELGRMDL